MIEQFPKDIKEDVLKVLNIIACFDAHKKLYERQRNKNAAKALI